MTYIFCHSALIALHHADDVSVPPSADIPLLMGNELAGLAWEDSLHDKDISRDRWPPFAVHIIYQAALSLIERKSYAGFAAVQLCLQPFKSALTIAQRRWLSAG
jgi:hypothetical protein